MHIERVIHTTGTPLGRARPVPLLAPSARIVEVQDAVLVLGSRQDTDIVDARAAHRAGVEVIRRHSGGGAVLLHPGRSLWIDVLLPRDNERWVADIGVSFHWLGQIWVAALAGLGVPAIMHRGGLARTPWGSLVCFGALGPGEVVVAGSKVVGMSQRRTRAGSRLEYLVHDAWEPKELLSLLVLAPEQRMAAADDLRDRAAGPGVDLVDLERSIVDRLIASRWAVAASPHPKTVRAQRNASVTVPLVTGGYLQKVCGIQG